MNANRRRDEQHMTARLIIAATLVFEFSVSAD